MVYPTYRLALVGIIAVALLLLYLVLYRTRLGMIVRAGIEDSVMVDSLGIDVVPRLHGRVRHRRHGGGLRRHHQCAGGVAHARRRARRSWSQTFVVVVIGGVGSFPGAVLGGLIAGEILSITSMINPGYSYVMLFAVMTLVLVVRPHGLLGSRSRD